MDYPTAISKGVQFRSQLSGLMNTRALLLLIKHLALCPNYGAFLEQLLIFILFLFRTAACLAICGAASIEADLRSIEKQRETHSPL